MADGSNNTLQDPSRRRGFTALAALALTAALPAACGAPLAPPGASLTPVAQAYAALQAVQARKAYINSGGGTEEEVDTWCDDDIAAVWDLAAAASETPHDVMTKLVAMMRRGEDARWTMMECEVECEVECLSSTSDEIERFFPELRL
ncbi:MAG: hypothetical protein JWO24_777 [Rhodospirillales bacterium]|nr:hypothetical protein [Rhodospirillales bacterium]